MSAQGGARARAEATNERLRATASAVAALVPGDAREVAARARILAELERLAHPFDEHADPVHLTASAVVVGPRGTLLHRHKRLGLWLQPGGHIATGEAPPDAAQREVQEETGVAAEHPAQGKTLVHVDVHDGAHGHTHLDLRYLLLADAEPSPPAGESPHVRWFSWPEALALADPGLVGALLRVHAHHPLRA